ncbi:MAG: Gfo/Idh/MocA family oxidoreductase, partial [Bacteroidota bacterium]
MKRRTFLGLSATAIASSAFPNIIIPSQEKKIGVALLGLGSYSTYQLAPALQMTKYCKLAGIVTGSPEKIPTWQKKYNLPDQNVYSYEDMNKLANNKNIDVVYVVTPTSTHMDFAVKAANAGKHVWCEKPMAMTVEECQTIIDACNQNKVQLTLGYRMLHEPNTITLNTYATSQPLGKMQSVDAAAGYKGGGGTDWRFKKAMGGGALYDMGVYPINGIRNAIQKEPIEVVSAKQYAVRPELFKEVDETTKFELLFPDGIKATGKTSVGENINHLRVTCEKGWYEMNPMQPYNGVKGERSDGFQLNQYIENQQAKQMDDDSLAILRSAPVLANA